MPLEKPRSNIHNFSFTFRDNIISPTFPPLQSKTLRVLPPPHSRTLYKPAPQIVTTSTSYKALIQPAGAAFAWRDRRLREKCIEYG